MEQDVSSLKHHLTLIHKATDENLDKYGVFCEKALTVTTWGDRQIHLLEQLVLLTLTIT